MVEHGVRGVARIACGRGGGEGHDAAGKRSGGTHGEGGSGGSRSECIPQVVRYPHAPSVALTRWLGLRCQHLRCGITSAHFVALSNGFTVRYFIASLAQAVRGASYLDGAWTHGPWSSR